MQGASSVFFPSSNPFPLTIMSESAANFSKVPLLDYALLSTNRDEFILQLRQALINVGFLYLSNPPVSSDVIKALLEYIPKLFALPQEEKDRIKIANSEHFLGYSRLGAEFTKGAVDYREQFDIATPHVCRWKPGEPDYYRLWGPSQVRHHEFIPCTSALISRLVARRDICPRLQGYIRTISR